MTKDLRCRRGAAQAAGPGTRRLALATIAWAALTRALADAGGPST